MNKKNIFIGSIVFVVIALLCFWFVNHYSKSNIDREKNKGSVSGHIDIGPICPVERKDTPCLIPPETYSSREVIIYKKNGKTIAKKVKIDNNGDYKTDLIPGNYFVQVKPAGIGEGEKKEVIIKSYENSVINFDIDTGIR